MKHFLNSYFDAIILISIERNRNRLNDFIINNPNLDFQVFNGVDGLLLFPDKQHVWEFSRDFFEENLIDYNRAQYWNKGQLGCALSNRLAHQLVVDNSYKCALILEDDALIDTSTAAQKIFESAISQLPFDWDLFYLGYNEVFSNSGCKKQLQKMKNLIIPYQLEGCKGNERGRSFFARSYSKSLFRGGCYLGTHAYAISNVGANKLLALDTPLTYGFDTLLFNATFKNLVNSFSLKNKIVFPNLKFPTTLINS